jgi:hypothetical protein
MDSPPGFSKTSINGDDEDDVGGEGSHSGVSTDKKKKSARERSRRVDFNSQLSSLRKLLIAVSPDLNNSKDRNRLYGNRVEVLMETKNALERLHQENEERAKTIAELTANLPRRPRASEDYVLLVSAEEDAVEQRYHDENDSVKTQPQQLTPQVPPPPPFSSSLSISRFLLISPRLSRWICQSASSPHRSLRLRQRFLQHFCQHHSAV